MLRRKRVTIILILGALCAVTPFSIDMYLPAFPQIAADLHSNAAQIAFSLSSYFVGLAIGQVVYGPLLDRFGRKRPLFFGLAIYILASMGCLSSHTPQVLIGFRFFQAVGGCVASVGSIAMVRDFFPASESSRIFSMLMLIVGVSPLLAPSIGSFVAAEWGWRGVFVVLSGLASLVLTATCFLLPEGHEPDPTVSLTPRHIFGTFALILKEPRFFTYGVAGSLGFAGIFVYVASSPVIFMDIFHLSTRAYGGVFALLSGGFIGGTQVNLLLTRWFRSEQILQWALMGEILVGSTFLGSALSIDLGLTTTILFFFGFLSCLGLSYPNAAALALAPFVRNAGSASALIGCIQIALGAATSACVALFAGGTMVATAALFTGTALAGFLVLLYGRRGIVAVVELSTEAVVAATELL